MPWLFIVSGIGLTVALSLPCLVFKKRRQARIWGILSSYPFLLWPGIILAPQARFNFISYSWHLVIACLLLFSGGLIGFMAISRVGLSQSINHGRPGKLITNDLYSLVRFPQYLAAILIHLGASFLCSAQYALFYTLVLILIFWLNSKIKERELLDEFGQSYQQYQKETPMFIPSLAKLTGQPLIKSLIIILLIAANFYVIRRTGLIKIILFGQRKLLDFDNYYRMVKDLFSGQHPYQLDYPQTLGPPLVLVAYFPFIALPLKTARSLITLSNLFAVYFLSYLLSVKYFRSRRIISFLFLSLLCLLSFPARFSFLMGQPTLVASLLVGVFLISKNSLVEGLTLSWGTVVKTYLGITALTLFRKRSFFWFIVFLTAIIILSFPIIKPVYYLDFLKDYLVRISFQPTKATNLDYYNQSLKSAFFRLGMNQWYSFVYPLVIVVSGTWLVFEKNKARAVVLAVLLSPVCWQHYFVLLFPIIVALYRRLRYKFGWLVVLGFSCWLLMIQASWLHGAEVNFLNGVLASHYFIGGLIILFLTKAWHA